MHGLVDVIVSFGANGRWIVSSLSYRDAQGDGLATEYGDIEEFSTKSLATAYARTAARWYVTSKRCGRSALHIARKDGNSRCVSCYDA